MPLVLISHTSKVDLGNTRLYVERCMKVQIAESSSKVMKYHTEVVNKVDSLTSQVKLKNNTPSNPY